MVKILCALYDLEKQHSTTLSLDEGEVFLSVDDDCRDGDWLCVVNGKGEVGFVPETYVEVKEMSDANLLFEIEQKIAAIHENTVKKSETGACKYSSHQKHFLRKLLEARRNLQVEKEFSKDPEVTNEDSIKPRALKIEQVAKDPNEQQENNIGHECSISTQTDFTQEQEEIHTFVIPETLFPRVIEKVRNATSLSHSLSIVAVATVLNQLKAEVPSQSSIFAKLLEDLENKKNDHSTCIESQDKQRLLEIFRRLWLSKDDEQQRSWPVHEDESVILSSLQELYRIVVDADPRVSREVVRSENYEPVLMLVAYYQMEIRSKLRLAMLHVFIAACELDPDAVDQLVCSVLPVELARDMQNHQENIELTKYSAILLTVLFCYGQDPPQELYDHINLQFLTFLLHQLQKLLDYTGNGDIANLCFSVLLAINLHMNPKNDDLVVEAIKLQDDVRALTEKLVLVVNRGDDPAHILDIPTVYQNSVLKLLVDLFANPTCARHFYTNDIKVLLDIVLRQLQDLPYTSKDRLVFLEMITHILRNTDYGEHCHQQVGLQQCFDSIMTGEDASVEEKICVQEIAHKFPNLFVIPTGL